MPGKQKPRQKPPWLTPDRWEEFPAHERTRSLRYYWSNYDDAGQPLIKKDVRYTIDQALDLLQLMYSRGPTKQIPNVLFMAHLTLDPRYPDQQLRTSINLPHGSGAEVRVAVFCNPDDVDECEAAGAYKCGPDLMQEFEAAAADPDYKFDFQVLLAKPDMMAQLARLGRVLGPRRLMPSPKSGTVVTDLTQGISNFKGGVTEMRMTSRSNLQITMGKMDWPKEHLRENYQAIIDGIIENRPSGGGQYFVDSMHIRHHYSAAVPISKKALEWQQ